MQRKGPKIEIYRKNTVNISAKLSGVADGATVYFTVKPDYDEDTTDTTGVIKAEAVASDGRCLFRLSPGQTDIASGKYVYDFKLVDGDTDVTLKVGKLKVLPAVTLRV